MIIRVCNDEEGTVEFFNNALVVDQVEAVYSGLLPVLQDVGDLLWRTR